MLLQEWDNSFSVNNQVMDDDHKYLLQLIRGLYEAVSVGRGKMVIEPLIRELDLYAKKHFTSEEKYLEEQQHPDLKKQRQQHQLFLEKIIEFRSSFENGQTVIMGQILPFLNSWFLNHIMKSDMRYKL